jgi:hypothetical protein
MISFIKRYTNNGYKVRLGVDNKYYMEEWKRIGDKTFRLEGESILQQIKIGSILSGHIALFNEIYYSADDEITDLIVKLENELREDKGK